VEGPTETLGEEGCNSGPSGRLPPFGQRRGEFDGFQKRRLIEFRISWPISERKSTHLAWPPDDCRHNHHAFRKGL